MKFFTKPIMASNHGSQIFLQYIGAKFFFIFFKFFMAISVLFFSLHDENIAQKLPFLKEKNCFPDTLPF